MTYAVNKTGICNALAGGRRAAPMATMIKMITPSQERGERA
ncbi:MAG TPA: hypothetical protein VG227_05250 [Caulobacteraceae bacterium]|nr:hypothetical protein [Caulobacteraceae bacterium]